MIPSFFLHQMPPQRWARCWLRDRASLSCVTFARSHLERLPCLCWWIGHVSESGNVHLESLHRLGVRADRRLGGIFRECVPEPWQKSLCKTSLHAAAGVRFVKAVLVLSVKVNRFLLPQGRKVSIIAPGGCAQRVTCNRTFEDFTQY